MPRTDGAADTFSFNVEDVASGRIESLGPSDGHVYRRLLVKPTDQMWGARSVLGYGDPANPSAIFKEGLYYYVRFWMRLDPSRDVSRPEFAQVFEMKQCWPYPLTRAYWTECQIRSSKWIFQTDWGDEHYWEAPFTETGWIPITVEGVYSSDVGWLHAKFGDHVMPRADFKTLHPTGPKFFQIGPYQSQELPETWIDYSEIEVWS